MPTDELNIDKRYQDIINYLTKPPWRKKEIAVLTAEKSNISDRTARERLKDLEKQGIIETVQISRNRVFVERNTDIDLEFNFETENKAKVQSLLEEARQLTMSIVEGTFPSQSRYGTTSHSNVLPDFFPLIDRFKSNKLPPKELKELEHTIEDINGLCREQLVVIHENPHLSYIFQIFDDLIFLLKNYDEIDNANKFTNFATLTTDLTKVSQMYVSFLNKMSMNAGIFGYEERYNVQLSDRISELLPLIETGPDFIREDIYYLVHPHGDISERINAFISNIKNQKDPNYDKLLNDVRSLYTEEEKDKLRENLRNIADELTGPQRTIVERLCVNLKYYDKYIQTDAEMKYYNRSKRKIIAILSHGSEKLQNIAMFSAESEPNVSSNIGSLSDDGYVNEIDERKGYYELNREIKKLFEEKRKKTPDVDREKVKKTLERMADWREEHLYTETVPIYTDEDEILQRSLQPPWIKLHSLVLDRLFVLKHRTELNSFFEILDGDIEELKKGRHLSEIPDEIIAVLHIAELLHNEWYKGLENIHYHSELSNRLADLNKAHNCVIPNKRRHIRRLISIIDLDEADALFKQAVVDNQENVDSLKSSIDNIYYRNNQMHKIVEFLSSNYNGTSTKSQELRRELLEYSTNIPYENQF